MNTFDPSLIKANATCRVTKIEADDPSFARPSDQRRNPARPVARTPELRGQDPTLALSYVHPKDLTDNPRNARTHSARQIKNMADTIGKNGFITPIIVDENGMILAGHGRHRAALRLGLDSVPIVHASNLSPAQKRTFVLADNRMAELAGWDREALAIELGELAVLLPPLDLDLALTGFDIPEIDSILLDRAQPKPDPQDIIPSLPNQPVTRRGDCWRLNDHRIVCGDARSLCDVDLLMAGERAKMLSTDPPFNVPIAGHVQGRGRVSACGICFRIRRNERCRLCRLSR